MKIKSNLKQILSIPFFFVYSFLVKDNKLLGVSIDTTYKCNLNCKHCYFQAQNYSEELPKNKLLNLLKKLRKKGVLWATWVGGEPLLRKDLIEEGKKIFPFNWVVTNGTISFPDWKNVTFFVSIDGPEEIHNQIRGALIYQRIKNNISEHPDLNICLGTTINRANYRYIEQIADEWSKTNIKGINYDFYTPLKEKDPLWLTWPERDKIIERLSKIKREYGSFILLTHKILQLMKSKNAMKVIANCPTKRNIFCLDPIGQRKSPCVMAGADCRRCGCITSYLGHAILKSHDFETVKMAAKLLLI